MKSHRVIAWAMVALLGVWSTVWAQGTNTISVDSRTISVGTETISVPVRFTGADNVSALAMTLQIGDGGPGLGGTEDLTITGFDRTGSIFDPALFDLVFSPPGTPNATLKVNFSPNPNHPGVDIPADGLIGSILVDTHLATSERTVSIFPTVTDAAGFPGLVTKAQDSSLRNLPLEYTPGRLEVVVPEPASLSSLAGGALVLLSRRRRRSAQRSA